MDTSGEPKSRREVIRQTMLASAGLASISLGLTACASNVRVLPNKPYGKSKFSKKQLGEMKRGRCHLSDQVEISVDIHASAKVFTLGRDLGAGDCHLVDGILTFNPNGNGTFRSNVKTDFTHTKDVYHIALVVKLFDGSNPITLAW